MSLFKFAQAPDAVPNPLPPLDARKSRVADGFAQRGAWPVDLLPAAALAQDLARLGVAFRRGVGYLHDGARVEPDDVAFLAATVIEAAADELPRRPREAAQERMALAQAELDTARANALAKLDALADDDTVDPDPAVVRSTYEMSTYSMRRFVAAARRDLDTLPDDAGQSWLPYAAALEQTAAELRTSPGARRRLLDALRPCLPAPAVAAPDLAALDAFLASFDARDVLRRSELSALYSEAGRPGGLSSADLRNAGDNRWGVARKSAGHHVWRPSRAAVLAS